MENNSLAIQALVAGYHQSLTTRVDTMFVNLFIAQWVVGIILAVIFSPLSWEGSHSAIHPHVYFAIFLGGALAAFPIVIIRFFPANPLNKYVVTTCQMLVSVLLIHLSSGRIETHFHIFGSLAFIAFYRNPRVIILATLITTLDHFLRGIYWPQLIFSTELSSPWRAFEHSAWVIFEDIFLFMSVSDGMRSLKIRARAQLALEDALEKTEQKVRERTSELEESQRLVLEQQQYVVSASKMSSLGEMAAGVAHEINNPLAIISSTTAFLSKSLEKGKMTDHLLKDCLSDIEQTVRRISKIVLGLRNVSRDSNAEEDDLVVIQDIFDDVLAISAEKFKNHGIELEIIDESGLLQSELVCRRVQISQVLLNLLMNAFDAVVEASGKRVLIRLTQDPASIHFAVQDSGKGIPESLRQKIFQPFFTTKEIGKGTGLGLSISQGIMKNHGGQLMLTEDSPGATFLMLLPKRTPARFRS